MRPLPQRMARNFRMTRAIFLALPAAAAWTLGCGGGSVVAPPPPPPSATVTVAAPASSILLGNQMTLTATVTNTSDTSVAWSVKGIAAGNPGVGTITTAGVYTAPADLPSPATVQITATSQANPTKSGTASVTVISDITLALAPNPASVELSATLAFQASVTSSGHPDTTVHWSLSGAACPSACGTVDASGTFTAPTILPSPTAVTVTAQSMADPSKLASATSGQLTEIAQTIT